MTLVFTADYVKNGVSICKLDVDVKNRPAVAGSVGFFKLEQERFNEKKVLHLLYSGFLFENQIW